MPSEVKPPKNPADCLSEAKEDLIEKISVAGWKEAFGEHVPWIRNCFLISLLILSGFSFFYLYQSVQNSLKSEYKDEIADMNDLEAIPFTNVSICAQVYFNETFIRSVVEVPRDVQEEYKKKTGGTLDDFYKDLTFYLSFIMRPRKFSAAFLKLARKLIEQNLILQDYNILIDEALPSCEKMLKKCWFDGLEFDCCSRAIRATNDDGICYIMMLNFDNDNAMPKNGTIHQTRPGPQGGLIIEASLSTRDFPMFESDSDNGFRLYISSTAIALTQTPIAAPHASVTRVRISPEKRLLAKKCAPYGHQQKSPFGFEDPDGMTGPAELVFETIQQFCNCTFPTFYTFRANSSSTQVCGHFALYALSWVVSGGMQDSYAQSTGNAFQKNFAKLTGNRSAEISEYLAKMKVTTKHCSRWTYRSTASFYDLEEPNVSMDDTMYSKIYLYYTDLSYRQYVETKEITVYLAFCDLGNVAGFYWGMSIISFFHVFWYVTRYFYFRWKVRYARRSPQVFPEGENVEEIEIQDEEEEEEPHCSYHRQDVIVTEL